MAAVPLASLHNEEVLGLLPGIAELKALDFSVRSVQGLQLSVAGVPVVRGSWFEYYDADWDRDHYSSQWNHQKIERKPDGSFVMTFKSGDGRALGTQTYERLPNGVRASFEFLWKGARSTQISVGAANLWATPLRLGQLFADGAPVARSLQLTDYSTDDWHARAYSTGASRFHFSMPFGTLSMHGVGAKWVLYDARGLEEPWVDGRDVWWLGAPNVTLRPNEPLRMSVEWTYEPRETSPAAPAVVTLPPQPIANALAPPAPSTLLVPKPKVMEMGNGGSLELGNDLSIDLPDRLRPYQKEFVHFVGQLWDLPLGVSASGRSNRVFTRIQDLGLPPEGYEIWISPQAAIIQAQDDLGLRHSLRTLAQLVRVGKGGLVLPACHIRDWPSTHWRGVHLFVGPDAPRFHRGLWENVLAPLKFNAVVVQCDRTDWNAAPGIATPSSISRESLRGLFEFYRSLGVDPVPLIQSFGHMEWLFANGKNLDLAAHPETPYRIDPRKPGAVQMVSDIWSEAIALLKPSTIHVGLDEVDARSFREDPEVITALWKLLVPQLGELARRHDVNLMLWGDKGLARGEAIDATHGDSMDDARARRDAIPKGALVADWHYKNDPKPDRFLNSLRLWKREGYTPIAATWFNPDNIRGFYQAAIREKVGTLQTTWAGYESNEAGLIREFRQFAAMVVAADYAWSGRTDSPAQLGYRPEEVFARLYFGFKGVLDPRNGYSLSTGRRVRIDDVSFDLFPPLQLHSILVPQADPKPAQLTIRPGSGVEADTLALAIDTAVPCTDNDSVAEVEVTLDNGAVLATELRYGQHVRASADAKAIIMGRRSNGLCGLRLDLGGRHRVVEISLRATSDYAGLRVHGVTLL